MSKKCPTQMPNLRARTPNADQMSRHLQKMSGSHFKMSLADLKCQKNVTEGFTNVRGGFKMSKKCPGAV